MELNTISKPFVSIIIPTSNRKDLLLIALESLKKLDYPLDKFEVIIVDDGSTDGTIDMLEAIKENVSYSLIILSQERKYISAAKNKGLSVAKGEIIVTTDDDCTFEIDWLSKLIEPFKDIKVGASGGPDRAPSDDTLFAKCVDYASTSFLGTGGIRGSQKGKSLGKFYPMGCNMAMRKNALDEIGCFEEGLAPGEDTDVTLRMERKGYKIVYVPEAFAWHRRRNSIGKVLKHNFLRGQARVEMNKKYPESIEFIYFLPAIMVLVFKSLLLVSLLSIVYFKILAGIISFYFLLLTFSSFTFYRVVKDIKVFLLIPLIISIQHFAHGIGLIFGYLTNAKYIKSKSI